MVDTEQTAPARRLPHSIGRYRILARLGKGAMGVVYSAHDSVMERTVAIKVMMTDFDDDPEASARFYREARSAGQLVHPNIITIFDMGEEDGRPFIVMELLDGVTLNKFLERPDAADLEVKIEVMIQICDGLQAAHACGIFHRDIKPGNLLVRSSGELKIVDFGIARLASSNMTASGLIVGTPDYMSPEQARGHEVDGRSDIFSAGAVFYYMLTGRKPFTAPDLAAVLLKVQTQDPLPIREVEAPAALASLVMKAMAKNPDDRYQTCAQMSAVLSRLRRDLRAEAQDWLDETARVIQAIESLATERRTLRDALDVVPSPAFDVACVSLRANRAALSDESRRSDIGDALAQARALHASTVADIERWRKASNALEQGVRASSAGACRYALDHFEAALAIEAGSRRAAAEADRCRRLLEEKRVADARVAALLDEARNAMAAKQWQAAAAVCRDVLRFDAASTEAVALQRRATDAIEAELREKRQEADRAIAKAEEFRKAGQFEEATRELMRARLSDPTAQDLQGSEDRVRASIADAEHDSVLAQASKAALEAARRAFEAGDRDRAIADLSAFHSKSPTPFVAEEIARLQVDAQRLAEAERRATQVAEHVKNAEAALAAGDPHLALDFATRALAMESANVLARKITSLARAEIKERTEAQDRAAAASRNLDEARQQLARGRFGKAKALVSAAAELNPADTAYKAVFGLIQQEESRVAAEAQRQRISKQRARAAAPIVERGQAALEAADYERAAWTAENALALDPDCLEAKEILVQSRERLVLKVADADDTVDLTAEGDRDPDDTVTLVPPSGILGRASQAVKGWVAALRPLGANQSGRH